MSNKICSLFVTVTEECKSAWYLWMKTNWSTWNLHRRYFVISLLKRAPETLIHFNEISNTI